MYKLQIHKQAAKYYRKLEPKVQNRINTAMEAIARQPTEGLHIKKLKGELEGRYRYDVSGLRIVYVVNAEEGTVSVDAIGPRGDIYK